MIDGVTRPFEPGMPDILAEEQSRAGELFGFGMAMLVHQYGIDVDEHATNLELHDPEHDSHSLIEPESGLLTVVLPDQIQHRYSKDQVGAVRRFDSVPAEQHPTVPSLTMFDTMADYHRALVSSSIAVTSARIEAGYSGRPVEAEEVRDLFMWLSESERVTSDRPS